LVPGPRAPAVREDFPSQEILSQIKNVKQRDMLKNMLKKDQEERFESR
jgi:hypothetical protein